MRGRIRRLEIVYLAPNGHVVDIDFASAGGVSEGDLKQALDLYREGCEVEVRFERANPEGALTLEERGEAADAEAAQEPRELTGRSRLG